MHLQCIGLCQYRYTALRLTEPLAPSEIVQCYDCNLRLSVLTLEKER